MLLSLYYYLNIDKVPCVIKSPLRLDKKPSFGLYSTNGNLTVIGTINANNGYFAGELRSKSGFFEGSITAKSGKIGGFNILEDKLTSEKTYIKVIDE